MLKKRRTTNNGQPATSARKLNTCDYVAVDEMYSYIWLVEFVMRSRPARFSEPIRNLLKATVRLPVIFKYL